MLFFNMPGNLDLALSFHCMFIPTIYFLVIVECLYMQSSFMQLQLYG